MTRHDWEQPVYHEGYAQLLEKVLASHQQGRKASLFSQQDTDLARLYCYGYRTHTIGAFHATREALKQCWPQDALAQAHLLRAEEHLENLDNQGMDTVPADFRVVVSTFHRYHHGVRRAIDALARACDAWPDPCLIGISARFAAVIGEISRGNGIYLTQDTGAPEQASFIVPNLGITIVPLIYGDHHSWNLAYLTPEHLDVPNHRHHTGVEIHLGYQPLEGFMILAEYKSPVTEGYALPIPPMTRHGWANVSGKIHHVPFIFGSLKQAGWGVFMDVEPQPKDLNQLVTVEREDWRMNGAVYLEREIQRAAGSHPAGRNVIMASRLMDRNGVGGLELAVTRINETVFAYPVDDYRIGSVVSGGGRLRIGSIESEVKKHDHFGIPAGMTATLRQDGKEPLVVLDSLIKTK